MMTLFVLFLLFLFVAVLGFRPPLCPTRGLCYRKLLTQYHGKQLVCVCVCVYFPLELDFFTKG